MIVKTNLNKSLATAKALISYVKELAINDELHFLCGVLFNRDFNENYAVDLLCGHSATQSTAKVLSDIKAVEDLGLSADDRRKVFSLAVQANVVLMKYSGVAKTELMKEIRDVINIHSPRKMHKVKTQLSRSIQNPVDVMRYLEDLLENNELFLFGGIHLQVFNDTMYALLNICDMPLFDEDRKRVLHNVSKCVEAFPSNDPTEFRHKLYLKVEANKKGS